MTRAWAGPTQLHNITGRKYYLRWRTDHCEGRAHGSGRGARQSRYLSQASDRKQGFGKYTGMVKNPCAPQTYHSYFRSLLACDKYSAQHLPPATRPKPEEASPSLPFSDAVLIICVSLSRGPQACRCHCLPPLTPA